VDAVAVKRPGVPFAVNGGEVARPAELVTAVACAPPPRNPAPAPDAPVPSENATVTPCTGRPAASTTSAWSGAPYVVFAAADWLVWPVAAIEAATPAAVFANENSTVP
jgi:hypothetical protein